MKKCGSIEKLRTTAAVFILLFLAEGLLTHSSNIAAAGPPLEVNGTSSGELILNEIHADPDAVGGDANGDGLISTGQDEFVEIINHSDADLDISGWTLSDAVGIRHVFPGNTILTANCGIVVFGGGSPTGSFGGMLVQTASSGMLGLNNTGDTITIHNGEADQAAYTYGSEGGDNQSLTLDPDITGSVYVKHRIAANAGGSLYSPGTKVDGTSFSGCNAAANILINEVDADTTGFDSEEFIELYDGGAGNTALDGYTIVFFDGDTDTSYAAFDLDTYTTDANGYFVLGNASVNGVDLQFNNDTLQNGADAVALYRTDAADFPDGTLITQDNLVDALVYDTGQADDPGLSPLLNNGQPQVNENTNGNSANQSSQRCSNGSGGRRNTSMYAQFAPTPGQENICQFSPVCGSPAALISAVQGAGSASSMVDSSVTVEAVVIADYQSENGLDGFFVQEEDVDADGDPATSDGIFIYHTADGVNVGDQVRLTGTVSEYYGLTEIKGITAFEICSTGNAAPSPAVLNLPNVSDTALEAYEGMLVEYSHPLYVTEVYDLNRYGQVILSGVAPLNTPTNIAEPGMDSEVVSAANALNQIILDDASNDEYPVVIEHLRSDGTTLRIGDTVANLYGVLNYSRGYYSVQPTTDVVFTPSNGRPAVPPDVGSDLMVASFNVLNYFTTIDTGNDICGPSTDEECRGADNAAEFTRQRDKIISALTLLDADVVGLIEIENTDDTALTDLVAGLNTIAGAGTYAAIHTGSIGTHVIKVALIYKPASVTPVGAYAVLDGGIDSRFDDTQNRPALAQTFADNASGEKFTVVVNHLKSKSSDCGGAPDDDPIQGNCNLTRTYAAQALVDWLEGDPTGAGSENYLIIGDMNSYAKEDPIDAIKAGADDTADTADDFTDLAASFGNDGALYSYAYNGERGYLDHALANPAFLPAITGAQFWHINADEPHFLDYNTEYGQDALGLYVPDAYRSSDHDPIVIGISFDILEAPLVKFPKNGYQITVGTTMMKWAPVVDAEAYELELCHPNGDLFDTWKLENSVCSEITCQFKIPYKLNAEFGNYQWRVRGIANNTAGVWSDKEIFEYIRLDAITQYSPINDTVVTSPTPVLIWEKSAQGVYKYALEIWNLEGTMVDSAVVAAASACSSDTCSWAVAAPLAEGTYKWRVLGKKWPNTTRWTRMEYFTIALAEDDSGWNESGKPEIPLSEADAISSPQPRFPKNGYPITTGTTIIKWTPVSGAVSYVLELYRPTEEFYDAWEVSDSACDASICQFKIPYRLSDEFGTWQWRVRGMNGVESGMWSSYAEFEYIQLSALTLSAPLDGVEIGTSALTFIWEQSSQSVFKYVVEVWTMDGSLVHSELLSEAAVCSDGTCIWSLSSPLPDGEYKWRVLGKKWPNLTPWTPTAVFTITSD